MNKKVKITNKVKKTYHQLKDNKLLGVTAKDILNVKTKVKNILKV